MTPSPVASDQEPGSSGDAQAPAAGAEERGVAAPEEASEQATRVDADSLSYSLDVQLQCPCIPWDPRWW